MARRNEGSGGYANPFANGGTSMKALKGGATNKAFSIVKNIGYTGFAADAENILTISKSASSTATNSPDPSRVIVANDGNKPAVVFTGYETYTDETTDDATYSIQTLLLPGESFEPPIRGVIYANANTNRMLEGTAVENEAPNSNMYVDSTADVKNDTLSNTNNPVNFGVVVSASANSNHIRVGDLIRVENEILEVLGTYEDDPTNSSLVEGDIRCKRGVFGSTNASHSATPDIRLPFFNAYHDFDKYSVSQTDSFGKFKSFNLFGKGRTADGTPFGIVPGSFSLKFYKRGYQEWGLDGISDGDNSGLVASTTYYLKVAVDGGSAVEISFATDASNLSFGGSNGVIRKIQNAINDKFHVAGGLFEKKVHVGIVDGDIRFTSGQYLSSSAIALTTGTSGSSSTNLIGNAIGRFPASVDAAVPAELPDDVVYDRITYASSPNEKDIAYDNGRGSLTGGGIASGSINYETGALNFTGRPNAEFVFSCLHTSPLGGKRDASEAGRANSLVSIHATTPNQKCNTKLRVETFT